MKKQLFIVYYYNILLVYTLTRMQTLVFFQLNLFGMPLWYNLYGSLRSREKSSQRSGRIL